MRETGGQDLFFPVCNTGALCRCEKRAQKAVCARDMTMQGALLFETQGLVAAS